MTDVVTLTGMATGLADGGVTDVIVCPGSRSTPLALAIRANPRLRVRVLLDERSAGYFALGLARASRSPVAVLVTSGTAVANLLPAVVEASQARVPLVVLTADRPPELRERGAPQTIDQVRIFGGYVRWFAELPLLDGEPETRRHVESVVARAVATARGTPAGPVHLNVPFREPLVPDAALAADAGTDSDDGAQSRPFSDVVAGPPVLGPTELEALATRLGKVERGLIVAGPQDDPALPAALARLAAASGFPIAADPLSGVRCGPHDRSRVLAHADHLVRPGAWIDGHRPDLVVRFGATPTSKPLLTLIAEGSPAQIVVDGDRTWSEAAIVPTTFVQSDGTPTADALADALADLPSRWGTTSTWADEWCQADRAADKALTDWLSAVVKRDEAFEGLPFAVLGETLPDGALLWAGNSMPVRDLDDWLPSSERAIRPLSNRGANGIDGVVSTALGAAAADVGPVVLVVGDLSFLHDLNALVAAKLHDLSATIVLVDNDGGGIFSFLPQAAVDKPGVGLPEHYEELFGTPHGIDVSPIVGALGGEYVAVGPRNLRTEIVDSVGRPGVRVLRLRTERTRNLELHREAAAAVAASISSR
jgi:2-succinyl-5-enolpyruvyl-6-hydroxy-3-cyclohexene-1-carboxylate synthase